MSYMDPKSGKVETNNGGGEFVKGVMIYTIKNDLMVTSMSTISNEISSNQLFRYKT